MPSTEVEPPSRAGRAPTPPSPPKSTRPKDLWFRSTQDEQTMSALSGSSNTNVENPPLTPSDGVYTSVDRDAFDKSTARAMAEPNTDTGVNDDFGQTNEHSAFDEDALESTQARPQGEPDGRRDGERPLAEPITSTNVDVRDSATARSA